MNLIVDSNIVFSSLITPNGAVGRLLLYELADSKLVCPHFLYDEMIGKIPKIQKLTQLKEQQVQTLLWMIVKRLNFIDEELIDISFQQQAYHWVKDIDKKDLLFVALSLQTGFALWTGDKELSTGLANKGFHNTITTSEIYKKL